MSEGLSKSSSLLFLRTTKRIISKQTVEQLVNQWLDGKDYFLTDISVSSDDRIVVEIDHEEGVWIEDCVELSRFIESHLDREQEDFELEVGSAGIGQPFKVLRQYEIHQGDNVEVLLADGRKLEGGLGHGTEQGFPLGFEEKVREEGAKRPKLVTRELPVSFAEVKWTKYLIDFK